MTATGHAKRYHRSFLASMVAYVALVTVTGIGLRALDDGSAWRYPLALLPVLPAATALLAFVRFPRTMDELQRRIQFEAFGIVVALTVLTTFSLGLLENAGLPRIGLIWVGPAMIAVWGMASAVVSRRYA
jgi:hypothetical protein